MALRGAPDWRILACVTPTTYNEVLVSNVRAARGRAGIEQETAAARMRALGFEGWVRQTVSKVERGERKVMAEEVPALAYVLQTTISRLMAPLDEDKTVEFRESGPSIPVESLRMSAVGQIVHGAFRWEEDKPVFLEFPPVVRSVASRMAAGEWPPAKAED